MVSDLRHFRYGETDREYTALCRREKIFLDRRTKWVHDVEGKRHILRFGRDKSRQHEQIFGDGPVSCKICGMVASELDHKQGGDYGRCDCNHNSQALCNGCHREKHGREIRSAKVTS